MGASQNEFPLGVPNIEFKQSKNKRQQNNYNNNN